MSEEHDATRTPFRDTGDGERLRGREPQWFIELLYQVLRKWRGR